MGHGLESPEEEEEEEEWFSLLLASPWSIVFLEFAGFLLPPSIPHNYMLNKKNSPKL